MDGNIYRLVFGRLYGECKKSPVRVRVTTADLEIILDRFQVLEHQVRRLEDEAGRILVDIKKVLDIP